MGIMDFFSPKVDNTELALQLLASLQLGASISKNYQKIVDNYCKKYPNHNDRALQIIELVSPPETIKQLYIIYNAYRSTKAEHRKKAIEYTEKYIAAGANYKFNGCNFIVEIGSIKQTQARNHKSFTYNELAKLYEAEYLFDKAEKAYKQAIKYGKFSFNYIGLARIYSKTNQPDKAISVFDEYLAGPITKDETKIGLIHKKEFEDKKARGYVFKPRKSSDK